MQIGRSPIVDCGYASIKRLGLVSWSAATASGRACLCEDNNLSMIIASILRQPHYRIPNRIIAWPLSSMFKSSKPAEATINKMKRLHTGKVRSSYRPARSGSLYHLCGSANILTAVRVPCSRPTHIGTGSDSERSSEGLGAYRNVRKSI